MAYNKNNKEIEKSNNVLRLTGSNIFKQNIINQNNNYYVNNYGVINNR